MAKKGITGLLAIHLIALNLVADSNGGYFLDPYGNLEGFIQENGDNGYIIMDEYGHIEEFIQENGNDGYMFLDPEGNATGFFQEH